MKKMFKGISIIMASLLLMICFYQKSNAQDVEVSYQTFYDDLSPYGQWVQDPQYGSVWVPNEAGDFRPYGSRGHWVMTDYGNTWVSDDPWGWACYHYGRWTYDSYYGWVWMPGYEWAPAWVSWRYGGGYSGWAPLGPGVSVGVSYNCPESWWVFVQPQYMYSNDCYHHWRGPSYNGTYIRQTTVINNYYVDNGTHVRYNYGPHADVIQRDTHQPVQVYHVSRTSRPGAPEVGRNTVSMYRPQVNRATQNSARPANVIQAPQRISTRPQAATAVDAGRQSQFRQQMQRQAPQNTGTAAGPRGNNQPQAQGHMQPQAQGRPQEQNRPQPTPQQQTRPAPQAHQPQPMNRPQPAAQPQSRPQPASQPQNRPQPQMQNRQQPMNRPGPQNRPQPAPQPQNRPQPQMQNRPQPAPQPQNRPQPQMQNRPQPMQQPRPQQAPPPRMEAPRPAPAQAPHPEPPHEMGGRR